jgi:putative addiction module killer protein
VNTIETTEVFDAWFSALRDRQAARRIQARIDRAEDGHFGDVKFVGEGVLEMRIHHGPDYRVYFTQTGRTIYLPLSGGDKSIQANDIKAAQDMARRLMPSCRQTSVIRKNN